MVVQKLLPSVGAAGIDCLEGITPPPLGDVQLGEVAPHHVEALIGVDGYILVLDTFGDASMDAVNCRD